MAPTSSIPAAAQTRNDAVTATALTVLRRAMVEGRPVTREAIEHEACVIFDAPPEDAMRELDLVAQRLGVSSLG